MTALAIGLAWLAFSAGVLVGAGWATRERATADVGALIALRVMAEAESDALLWEIQRERVKRDGMHREIARLRRAAPWADRDRNDRNGDHA